MTKRLLLALLTAQLLAACSRGSGDATSYEPAPSDVTLEEWAERHPLEYKDWEASQHGQAYLAGDEDAPACTDCHGDPDTGEVHTAAFRLEIPGRCARCHADEALMSAHEVSADVYQTYLADYHGTTIEFYRDTSPDTWRFEAVCSDCHGSHAVNGPEVAKSSVAPANLTATCQKCHHDATASFTTAFGHYRPARTPVSSAETPLIFWVKLFYQVLTPVILGAMVGYIALDLRHRAKQRIDHDD